MTKHIVNEIFRIVGSQEDKIGQAASDALCINVLASYVGTLVYNVLTEKQAADKTKTQVLDRVYKNFAGLKTQVQEAVAAGFTGAMKRFTNKDIEYYCRVTPVPEPLNKRPC